MGILFLVKNAEKPPIPRESATETIYGKNFFSIKTPPEKLYEKSGYFIHERKKLMFKKKKEKNKIIVPVFETNPIPEGEKGGEKTLEDAIEMAKRWVDENKL